MSLQIKIFRIFLISLACFLGVFSYGEYDEDEIEIPEYCNEENYGLGDDVGIMLMKEMTCVSRSNHAATKSGFCPAGNEDEELCAKSIGVDSIDSWECTLSGSAKEDSSTRERLMRERTNNCEKAEGRKKERQEQLEEAEEQQKEKEEETKRLAEEAARKEEERIKTQDQECSSSYQNTLRDRGQIESKVTRKQADLDNIEDQITAAHTKISEAEDNVRGEILKLKEGYQQTINQVQSQDRNSQAQNLQARQAFDKTIEQVEAQLFEQTKKLEQFQTQLSQICSERFSGYLEISAACHSEALKTVSAEREELFSRIRNDQYTPSSLDQLFSSDAQGLEQTFNQRLRGLRQQCYLAQTGGRLSSSGEPIANYPPCDLESLTKRREACEKVKNKNPQCPKTPKAIAIENKVFQSLTVLKDQKEIAEKSRESLKKSIDQAKESEDLRSSHYEETLTQMSKQLEEQRESFDNRLTMLNNRLQQVREESENKIFSLEKKRMRVLESDPGRHFQETLYLTRVACCMASSTKSQTFCRKIDSYERDIEKYSFTEIKSLPYIERKAPSGGRGGTR